MIASVCWRGCCHFVSQPRYINVRAEFYVPFGHIPSGFVPFIFRVCFTLGTSYHHLYDLLKCHRYRGIMHLTFKSSILACQLERQWGFFFSSARWRYADNSRASTFGRALFINISGCQEQRDRDTPLLLQISYFPYKRALCMCTCIFPRLHTWDINTRDLKWANADFNLSGIILISLLPKTILKIVPAAAWLVPCLWAAEIASCTCLGYFFLERITIHLMQNWVNVYLDFFFYPVQHCVNMVIAAI